MLGQSVTVFGLADILLLFHDLECAQVLLQLSLVDPMFVLAVLKFDLSLLLDHSLLVKILEHQMLKSLTPNLDCNRVLFLQVLMLSILVTKFSLLVLKFLLGDEPEVVDSETLVIVLTCGYLFFLNKAFESTALIPHRLLVLLIVVVINGVGSCQGFLFRVEFLIGAALGSLIFLGRHSAC